MAVSSGFFDSQNGDRKYTAMEMSQIFDGIIKDGIYRSIYDDTDNNTTPFKTVPGTGIQVIVKKGRAWCNHCWLYNDGPVTVSLSAAPASGQKRYDTVALEFDQGNRRGRIVHFTGTATSGTPSKPNPHASDTSLKIYMPIAYVLVEGGATSLTQSKISQTCIGTDAAPYVTSPLEAISVSEFVAEWRAEQIAWMNSFKTEIQGLLTQEQAGWLFECIKNTARTTLRCNFKKNKYEGKYLEAVKYNTTWTVGATITATDSERGYKSLFLYNEFNPTTGGTSEVLYGTWTVSMYESSTNRTQIGPSKSTKVYNYGYHTEDLQMGTDKTITVTFDNAAFNGLTCTLKNGTETYTAVIPSSGTKQVVFDVQTTGTWTASVTVSGKTYSGSVSTPNAGNYTIAISYITRVNILYSGTDKLITGIAGPKIYNESQKIDSSATFTKASNTITIKHTGYTDGCGFAWKVNGVNFSDYSKLTATFTKTTGSAAMYWGIGGAPTSFTSGGNTYYRVPDNIIKKTASSTNLDISSISGTNVYIYMGYPGNGQPLEFSLKNIYIDP